MGSISVRAALMSELNKWVEGSTHVRILFPGEYVVEFLYLANSHDEHQQNVQPAFIHCCEDSNQALLLH